MRSDLRPWRRTGAARPAPTGPPYPEAALENDRPIESPWAKAAADVIASLATSERGLEAGEARARLESGGLNELERERPVRARDVLLRQFRSPLIYILVLAGAVTTALGEHTDTAVIAAVLVFNGTVGFLQEYRAERSLEALRRLGRARARVLRSGREVEIDARELVPGDLVMLEAGDKVPADCRTVAASGLEVDESLLTGESVPVPKHTEPVAADAEPAERANALLMGTVVTRGRGTSVVVATAAATELGRIAGSLREIEEPETPLQIRMGRLTRLIGAAALASAALGFALGLGFGGDLEETLRAMIALAVAALPEGLPIVLTITLAVSVNRMAERGAIVRRLPAVETLGSCTVIGSDKTGTLTENRMTVERILAGERFHDLADGPLGDSGEIRLDGAHTQASQSDALGLTLIGGALCNDASLSYSEDHAEARGDPTEVALLAAAAKAGFGQAELSRRFPRVAEIPFDSGERYAATFHRSGDRAVVFAKGAPERILGLCDRAFSGADLDRSRILEHADRMASEGLRVLAIASRELEELDPSSVAAGAPPRGLTFLGLQGMMDPPRRSAREAIRGCQRAGIRVLMVTGDHATTAQAIGGQLGISAPGARVVTGRELDELDDRALESTLETASIYARVSPHHKLRIAQALQRGGEVVAITGDGVNDAPALRGADIGAAMGHSGTEVAKEAADMVVTDDDFATIFAAVEEGRVAFDNVRKTTFFLISGNAAAVLVVLAGLPLGVLPLVAAQLLWLNLVTNGVQDIALAFEPGERQLLSRPPRPRREGIISRVLWERTLIAALVMAAGTLLLFFSERAAGDEHARTVALTALVVFQAVHVGNSRSEYLSAFAKSPFSNRFLFVGTLAALGAHIGAMHLPLTQLALHLEPLPLLTWLKIAATSLTVVLAVEAHKLVRRAGAPQSAARDLAPGSTAPARHRAGTAVDVDGSERAGV